MGDSPLNRCAGRVGAALSCALLCAVQVVPAQKGDASPRADSGGQGADTFKAKAPLGGDRLEGQSSVGLKDVRRWLGQLASEEFGGRGTGSAGFEKAAKMVAAHFEALGMVGKGDDGGFLQRVPWQRTTVDPENTSLRFAKGDQSIELAAAELFGNLGSNQETSAPVVLVIVREADAPGLRDLPLEGKIAVAWSPTPGLLAQRAVGWRVQRGLRRAKAAAAILVSDKLAKTSGQLNGRSSPGGGIGRSSRSAGRMPSRLVVSNSVGQQLLALAGKSADTIDETAVMVDLGVTADIKITGTVSPAPAFNVVGEWPGSDPKLKDEYVVIGSHLDHLGTRGQTIHPGADDDASGTTGVLAVAQMFAKNSVRPRRSVLFVCFCGEENGLIGSRYFVENSPIPLSAMVGELQMDMIGRNEQKRGERAEDNLNCLHLVGSKKLSSDLHELCIQHNSERANFDLEWDEESVFYRSDHWNFARKGVPIAFFFTGFHPDYHKPSDTADKINYPKLLRIASYVYDIGFTLAQSDTRPLVDADKWESLARKGSKEPAAPVRH